jgi:hypothetical protein
MELANNPGISPKKPEVSEAASKGYEAQGYALAQVVIAGTINAAKQLQNAVVSAFGYSVEARTACVSALKKWQKECRDNVNNSGNLSNMEKASLNKIANSATVRTSEFGKVVEAMNAGMTLETLASKHGIEDPENVSFHVIVADARDFLKSSAAVGQGRPADPLNVKLDKWLQAQLKANPAVADEIATIREDLRDYLPKSDPDTSAAAAVHSGKRKSDALTKVAPIAAAIKEQADIQHVPAAVARRRRQSDNPAVKH